MTDSVSRYLAPLGQNPVAVQRTVDGKTVIDTVPAKREISIQDLLRHTSGIPYGGRGNTPVHKLYPASSTFSATTMTGEEFLAKLASLPLLYQPGTVWDYSLSTDVLGLLLEAATGRKLGQFLHNGSAGDYNWMGVFGTWFWVDPKEQLAVVNMAQTLPPINAHFRQLLAALVYQAIAD